MNSPKPFKVTQILNAGDLELNESLVDRFFNLYADKANFPDPAESEDPDKIRARIKACQVTITDELIEQNAPNPFTHLICLEREDQKLDNTVVAGCVVEYYPKSACALLTYVFVDPKCRGEKIAYTEETTGKKVNRGYGSILLEDEQEGLPSLVDYFNRTYARNTVEGGKIKAVFFESNNPLKTANDSMPPHKRLKFFRETGAKWLDFDYVQPPIKSGEPPVYNLLLFTFPRYNSTSENSIPVLTIMYFILELAKSLDKNLDKLNDVEEKYGDNFYTDLIKLDEIQDALFQKKKKHEALNLEEFLVEKYSILGYEKKDKKVLLQNIFESLIGKSIKGTDTIYLSEIPRTENPRFLFRRASVTMHILVDEDYFTADSYLLSKANGHLVKSTSRDTEEKEHIKTKYKNKYKSDYSIEIGELTYCAVCHSFETDLFSYHNQFNPPYYTKSYLVNKYVLIRFPARLDYTSEGRVESMFVPQDYTMLSEFEYQRNYESAWQYVPLRLTVSYTYFYKSNIRVWNITFSSGNEMPVDELMLIKLTKFFTGSQENKSLNDKQGNMLNSVGFAICDEETAKVGSQENYSKMFDRFQALPEALFGDNSIIGVKYSLSDVGKLRLNTIHESYPFFNGSVDYKNIKTGTLQIDMSEDFVDMVPSKDYTKRWRVYLEDFFKDVYYTVMPKSYNEAGESDRNDHFIRVKDSFNEKMSQVLCGTTLGIFDFGRMGFEEVEDTLTPRAVSVKKYSFLTINRGSLTSYHSEKDSVMDSAWNNLGVNPYLIIPNAVLTHNEYVLLDADELLKSLLRDLRKGKEYVKNSSKNFTQRRNEIDSLISNEFVSNVFHYKTERDLYKYGSEHRGIESGLSTARQELDQVDKFIEQFKSKRDKKYQRTVEAIGFVIGLTTIFGFIKEIYTLNDANHTMLLHVIAWFIPFAIISLLVYFFYKKKGTRDTDEADEIRQRGNV